MSMDIRNQANSNGYFFFKRIMDVLFASVIGICLLPFMLVIALMIKIDSKGPVLFQQERTGKDGKKFTLYKFRSMVADNDVHDFKNADRHTKVGTFIRKTSIDELPQIINILKGDMSFIGPRPWIPDYYENMNEEQRHRCDVLPGITGLAQVKGRNTISIFDKINYDLEYVHHFSWLEDIKIVFWTFEALVSKKGADAGKTVIKDELNDLRKSNVRVSGNIS